MKQGPHGEATTISRRKFGHLTFFLVPLVYASAFVVAVVWYLLPLPGKKRTARLEVGPLQEFLSGKVATVLFNDRTVHVLEDKEKKKVQALSARCPHYGCNVNWLEGEEVFKCPCHGMIFSRDGKYVSGPTPKDLSVFKVEVQNDTVVLIDEMEA